MEGQQITENKKPLDTQERLVAANISKELAEANTFISKELAEANTLITKELAEANALITKELTDANAILAKTTQSSTEQLRRSNEIYTKLMYRVTVILVAVGIVQIGLAIITLFNSLELK